MATNALLPPLTPFFFFNSQREAHRIPGGAPSGCGGSTLVQFQGLIVVAMKMHHSLLLLRSAWSDGLSCCPSSPFIKGSGAP